MNTDPFQPMLVVASQADLPVAHQVWGGNGWTPPEQREALDWLTLSRLLGWGVQITRRTKSGFDTDCTAGNRYVILACDPDCLGEDFVAKLTSRLASEPLLVIARVGAAGGAWAHLAGVARDPEQLVGQSLSWIGPGPKRRWKCRRALEASSLQLSEVTVPWATLEGAPLIAARPVGRGVIATLGFHPSQARDADGAATSLLKHLLIWGAVAPVAWLDFEGSLILRMDDPGGAQNVHLRSWYYPKLGDVEWNAVVAELKRRNARLSIGYSAGWVDDGDGKRGALYVAGRMPRRIAGSVHAAPLVQYHDCAGHAPGTWHDYEAEFRGIQAVRAAGVGDVECHGYTHMFPDSGLWAQAPDRYEADSWYREFNSAAQKAIATCQPNEHPLALGVAALHRHFGVQPTTLICPGDQWTNDVLTRALDFGFSLVGNYYTALRDRLRFCWVAHIYAPYLDQPHSAWFDAGLPVAAYFHDRDLALAGVDWLSRWLDSWQEAGAKRFMDFREFAAVVGQQLYWDNDSNQGLVVTSASAPPLVRPLTVYFRLPGKPILSHLFVRYHDTPLSLPVVSADNSIGRVTLPCTSLRDLSM